jgi:hypothetical protein
MLPEKPHEKREHESKPKFEAKILLLADVCKQNTHSAGYHTRHHPGFSTDNNAILWRDSGKGSGEKLSMMAEEGSSEFGK